MTNVKFCDVHASPNTVVRQENAGRIHLTKWNSQIRRNLHLFLDSCNPDIMAKLLEPAKANGVDVDNGWRVEVLIRPSTPKYNTTKKWRKVYMSIPEFNEYQEAIADIVAEQPEVEEEEPPVQKVVPAKRK